MGRGRRWRNGHQGEIKGQYDKEDKETRRSERPRDEEKTKGEGERKRKERPRETKGLN